MEIKTCEEYVIDQLNKVQEENTNLHTQLQSWISTLQSILGITVDTNGSINLYVRDGALANVTPEDIKKYPIETKVFIERADFLKKYLWDGRIIPAPTETPIEAPAETETDK